MMSSELVGQLRWGSRDRPDDG